MDWQAQNDHARFADQKALNDRLTELEGNLAETLGMSLLCALITPFDTGFSQMSSTTV